MWLHLGSSPDLVRPWILTKWIRITCVIAFALIRICCHRGCYTPLGSRNLCWFSPISPRCWMGNPSHVRTALRLNDFCLYSTLNRFYFYSVQGGRPVKLQWPRFPRFWIGDPCLLFYVRTFSHRLLTWENLLGGPALPSLQYSYKLQDWI